jgi:hypothetical protein
MAESKSADLPLVDTPTKQKHVQKQKSPGFEVSEAFFIVTKFEFFNFL